MRVTLNFPAFDEKPPCAYAMIFKDGAVPRKGEVIKVYDRGLPTHIREHGTFLAMSVIWEVDDRGCNDVQLYLSLG